jgi:cobalt-zinc-cadmium resistance protein CzcA
MAMHAVRIPSTSLSQATEMQTLVEKTLLKFPQVAYVYSKTGTAEMASDPMPPNVSDTFIMLKPKEEWPDPHLDKTVFIEQLQEELEKLPGNHYEFTQPIEMRFNELIAGVRSDVAVKIYGDDFALMSRTASAIGQQMRKIRGSQDIKVGKVDGLPVLNVKIDREQASRLGVNVADGLEALAIATGGGRAGQLFEGDQRYDILVRLPERERADLTALGNLPIPLPGRKSTKNPYVPLNQIAALQVEEGLNEVKRENGKRFIAVETNVRGRDLGSFVEEAKRKIQAEVSVPEGYWLEWGGQFENLTSARGRLLLVVPFCLGLIFLLLYTALNSVRSALLVFTGVPLALTGGILSLWVRDMPFSISAAVGFIALSGIAVLNGLVLITCINQLLAKTGNLDHSITEGALMRLRPVLMTAFVPMALAAGTGAEVQKPLATVVIGGLISSTLLTLVILPALYKLFQRKITST